MKRVGRRTIPSRVVLLSGGLDSVVAATHAARNSRNVLALTFDYGQPSAAREMRAAKAVAGELGIGWRAVHLRWLEGLLPRSLRCGARAVPRVEGSGLDDRVDAARRARAVWVPNRNGVFLNIAAAYAEATGADAVVAGFNREEAASFPDNSAAYMKRATSALALSTLSRVRVESPTVGLTKRQIVRLGLRLGAPLSRVWSCYRGDGRMCGRCESCARLLRALRAAKVPPAVWPEALPRRARASCR